MLAIKVLGAQEIDLALEQRLLRLMDLRIPLEKGAEVVHEATRQRFESAGDGQWPPLAESTVARKESQGMAEPEKALFATGNLFESATSASGPYSTTVMATPHAIAIGIDWAEDGWQIPMVLSQGTDTAGRGHDVHIPARPIWPSPFEVGPEIAGLILEYLA